MFKINRKIEYALISLKYMNDKKEGSLTSAKEICDRYNVPFDPTSRVLQIMTQQGLLSATQGAKGGYSIVKNLKDVPMKYLAEIIAGPIEIANCMQGENSTCEIQCQCEIIGPMLNLNDKLNELFATVSVQDLLEHNHCLAEKAGKSETIPTT